jgi:hypothetical protein
MLGLAKRRHGEFKQSGFRPTGNLAPVSPYFMRQQQILLHKPRVEWNRTGKITVLGKVDMSKPDFTSYPVGDRNEREKVVEITATYSVLLSPFKRTRENLQGMIRRASQ